MKRAIGLAIAASFVFAGVAQADTASYNQPLTATLTTTADGPITVTVTYGPLKRNTGTELFVIPFAEVNSCSAVDGPGHAPATGTISCTTASAPAGTVVQVRFMPWSGGKLAATMTIETP